MKKVIGLEKSINVLTTKRGINLDGNSKSISRFSEAIFGKEMSLLEYVNQILEKVKAEGDKGIHDLSLKIDGENLERITLDRTDLKKAYDYIPSSLRDALEFSASRISKFHESSIRGGWHDDLEGYGQRFVPVGSAAAYIPGGTAKYPSTVLMTAIPAKVSGVEDIAITCPMPNNHSNYSSVLAAAYIANVDHVYCLGGAQAIAALAYGTESVSKVDFICGPGNIYVTLAKKLVYGDVGIDGLYGPTETVVIADSSANPTLCAADLIAQAEHDPLARAVLITDDPRMAEAIQEEIDRRVPMIDRSVIAKESIENQGVICVVGNIDEAFTLSNAFAPEHVSLAIENPVEFISRITNAGMVFTGELSHEVLGDYGAGPSHVMPTAGTARFNSGLGTHSFLKIMPVVSIDSNNSHELGNAASLIAREEGLTGHAEAAEIRFELN